MINENTYLIYKYTSPSGKSYNGQTKDLKRRETQHISSNGCRAFSNAINKYGFENFTREILEENLTLDVANIKEEYYISIHNTMVPNGYNLQSGGNNKLWSAESKALLSLAVSGENNPMFGRCGDANPMFGKRHSPEALAKISGDQHYLYGKHHSPEWCVAHSKAIAGENNPRYGKFGKDNPASKKYIITFPDGHEEIITGLNTFCKRAGLNTGNMSWVAKGKKLQHKGFKCAYYNKSDN
jgi:group I intron endonuclease